MLRARGSVMSKKTLPSSTPQVGYPRVFFLRKRLSELQAEYSASKLSDRVCTCESDDFKQECRRTSAKGGLPESVGPPEAEASNLPTDPAGPTRCPPPSRIYFYSILFAKGQGGVSLVRV